MRLALVSDIHANLAALEATLADIARRSVDRIVCLGDLVGYNKEPAECIALLRSAECVCVAGNHDLAVCGRITTRGFSRTAARGVAWTRRQLAQPDLDFLARLPRKTVVGDAVVAVHGALHPEIGCESVRLDNDERRLQSFIALMAHPSGARICAFGHTHRTGVYEWRNDRVATHPAESELQLRDDAYYLINPGTVGEPRLRDRRASYMVLDLERGTVIVRHVDYAAAAARQGRLAPRAAISAGAGIMAQLSLGLAALWRV
jgi:predicted phosphodiesterase